MLMGALKKILKVDKYPENVGKGTKRAKNT